MLVKAARLLTFMASVCLASEVETTKAAYQPSDENFPNPERGFFYQTSYQPRPGYRPPMLNSVALRKWRDSGISLVRMYYVFSEYRDQPLTSSIVERIVADLGAIREAGMKVIPRFAYNFGPTGEPDASLERIVEHLDQLSPVFTTNQDVIAFVEAGFIGKIIKAVWLWGRACCRLRGAGRSGRRRGCLRRACPRFCRPRS